MFKKSLRLQIVGTFIVIVLISLFLSFSFSRLFIEEEVSVEEPFLMIARDTASLLSLIEPDQREQLFRILSNYNVSSEMIEEGNKPPFSLTQEDIELLFESESSDPLFLSQRGNPIQFLGVPNINNTGDALILKIDFSPFAEGIQRIVLIGLFMVLAIGSLLILFSSNYIVKPVIKLINAAKEMATGNLSVRLSHTKKDEIGELMDSFNFMASELQKIDKMRDDFVSNVSHEIQSPITSIRGFTKAIRDGVIPQDHQKEYLDIIHDETLRLSKLSDNLLRLASLDSENHPFHPVEYRLDEQLRRMILVFEPLWTQKNLAVELDLQDCRVKADKDLLEHVWNNLITNAIKYSDDNDKIKIKIEMLNQKIYVHINDTGRGIPAEDLPYIFDRFYMVDKARGRSGGSNGLGLSLVKKIIELHDFKIEVTSEEEKGTCITVSIPQQG